MKTIAYGFVLDNNSYLRDSWNKFDCTIVMFSIVDIALDG